MTVAIAYVSNADSGDVHVLALDEASGKVATLQAVPIGGMAMPLALRPDRRVLYVVRRSGPMAVLAFAIDPRHGTLVPLGEAPLPASMAYVATDATGRWLFSASYHGNMVAVSPLAEDGRPQPAQQLLPTGPKAHAMRSAPGNRHVLATVLGADRVLQFRFDAASGRLAPNDPPSVAVRAGAGPRHFVFHPSADVVYLLNELDASVDVFDLDRTPGTLAHRQTVSALPPGFTGEPWAAELRLTPDGRFLYASERRSSTLAGFAVDAGGALTPIGHWPTQAQPRGFAIDPSGRWLVAAGQLSDRVGVHRIDAASGALTAVGEHAVGRNPNWVEAIRLG